LYPGRQPKVNVSRFLFLCRARSSSMRQRWRCIHARMNKTNAYFFRWSMVIMSTTQRGALCRESACSRPNHQRNDIISPKLPCCRRDEDALPSRCSIFGSDFRDFIKKIEKNTDKRAACGRFHDETRVFARCGRVSHKIAGCATKHTRAQRSCRPIAVRLS